MNNRIVPSVALKQGLPTKLFYRLSRESPSYIFLIKIPVCLCMYIASCRICSYPWYWTGTSLQWISLKFFFSFENPLFEPQLQGSNSPIPGIWSIKNDF